MTVDEKNAVFTLKKAGRDYYFCSKHCQDTFAGKTVETEGSVATDPVCQMQVPVKRAAYTAEKNGKAYYFCSKHCKQAFTGDEVSYWRKRLIVAALFGIPLLYLAMGEWFGLPVPAMSFVLMAAVQFVLATPIMIVSWPFMQSGIPALFRRVPNMDTLVAIGTLTAYAYSIAVGVFAFLGQRIGDLYFEIAGVLLLFIILGKYLEAVTKGRTGAAIKKLLGLQAKTALVIRKKKEVEIPLEEVVVGDVIIVKPGQKIPVDGIILEGRSSIDESAISGESIPVAKQKGDAVIGATINKAGSFTFKATKVGKDTVLASIIKLVEEAQASKAPIQRLADVVSYYFVPAVIAISIISFAVWSLLGYDPAFSLTAFIAVLIIACPCALGLATPTAIMMGTGLGAQHGILFKSAQALQEARELHTIVFDKTGTLTKGEPAVTDIHPVGKNTASKVLQLAAIVEKRSEHPLAEAIVEAAKAKKLKLPASTKFKAITGKGVEASYAGKQIVMGNQALMDSKKIDITPARTEAQSFEEEGKTAMFVAYHKKLVGVIAVADTLKEQSQEAVALLQKMGLQVILMTGDNVRVGEAIGRKVGIDTVLAQVLPGQKAERIKQLQAAGKKVAMVGDGINDAPALTQANVGIAIGSGTDVAIESGDIVLIKDDLRDVVTAMDLSRYTISKIKQNLFWAFIYNSIGIPIAAGVLFPWTGWLLNPIIAGAAMAFSSVSVVTNSLLMRGYRPRL